MRFRTTAYTTYWWQPVLAVTLVSFTVTAALFTVGIARLTQDAKESHEEKKPDEEKKSPTGFDDPTFVILLSQIIPNFLTIFYEVSKQSYEAPVVASMKSHFYFYVAMALAAGLSLAAPIVCSIKSSDKSTAAILNFCATLIIIFAGLLGVFEVGIKKNGSLSAKKTWRVWKLW